MSYYFCFHGKSYSKGTIVKIAEHHKDKFGFYSYVIFDSHDTTNNTYCFKSLYNAWDIFRISEDQLNICIEAVEANSICNQDDVDSTVNPKYIEGIISAWIWYIVAMISGLFLQNISNVIGVWVIASVIFFNWRRKKINGE